MNIPIKDRELKLERRASVFLKEHGVTNTVDVAARSFAHKPYANDYYMEDKKLYVDESR